MIDKCVGNKCPLRSKCLRYTSPKVNDRQSIIRAVYYIDHNNEFQCNSYWGNQADIILYNLTRFFEIAYEYKKPNTNENII